MLTVIEKQKLKKNLNQKDTGKQNSMAVDFDIIYNKMKEINK